MDDIFARIQNQNADMDRMSMDQRSIAEARLAEHDAYARNMQYGGQMAPPVRAG